MVAGALGGQQVAVDDFAQQRVMEHEMGIGPVARPVQDPPVRDLVKGLAEVGRWQLGHLGEEPVVDPRSGRRGDAQDFLAGIRDGR